MNLSLSEGQLGMVNSTYTVMPKKKYIREQGFTSCRNAEYQTFQSQWCINTEWWQATWQKGTYKTDQFNLRSMLPESAYSCITTSLSFLRGWLRGNSERLTCRLQIVMKIIITLSYNCHIGVSSAIIPYLLIFNHTTFPYFYIIYQIMESITWHAYGWRGIFTSSS